MIGAFQSDRDVRAIEFHESPFGSGLHLSQRRVPQSRQTIGEGGGGGREKVTGLGRGSFKFVS